ncbi:hypothetical protein BpHYR1_032912 [Brachionus plicatilis]|uniref:Uncharacterized protein n=1 Tax=Brachionus plicatilis TaxID=10195 RepID=A0A3M7T501_BRAPC|nr:hypothetical protein BpHYR1_032912 [Brachionus plicatilis]
MKQPLFHLLRKSAKYVQINCCNFAILQFFSWIICLIKSKKGATKIFVQFIFEIHKTTESLEIGGDRLSTLTSRLLGATLIRKKVSKVRICLELIYNGPFSIIGLSNKRDFFQTSDDYFDYVQPTLQEF